jgi:hypothetical protein
VRKKNDTCQLVGVRALSRGHLKQSHGLHGLDGVFVASAAESGHGFDVR